MYIYTQLVRELRRACFNIYMKPKLLEQSSTLLEFLSTFNSKQLLIKRGIVIVIIIILFIISIVLM